MNTKISNKDLKLLLYVASILLLVLGYFVGYRHFQQVQVTLDEETVRLQAQVDKLNEIYMNEASYKQQTELFNAEIESIYTKYPAEVREEDAILYACGLEDSFEDIAVSTVGVSKGNQLFLLGTTAAGATDTTAAVDSEATTDTTTDASVETDAATATTPEQALGIIDESSVQLPSIALFDTVATYDFNAGYEDCKSVFAAILACADQRNIPSISLSYDGESGLLVGNMTVNMYYMTGTDKTYNEPDSGQIVHGLDNIFGTVKTPAEAED